MSAFRRFFSTGGKVAYGLIIAVVMICGASTALLATTADIRYRRDVTRMVFNDNLEVLDDVRKRVGASTDTLKQILADSPELPGDQPYLVVSIEDHRLWYKQGDRVLYETQVATGSGKVLSGSAGNQWKFETPRGRLVVQSKETDPVWVPPDWHFVELAKKKGLGLVRLARGQALPAGPAQIAVSGNDVVRRLPDGTEQPLEAGEGREIVANGNVIVPPFGTNQRKFAGVLGTHRLNLGDGYALHGTDKPETIGRSVSHGCIRLRNEDIETLYRMVPVGTPIYIY
jgi:hypothetical protein